MPIQRYKAWNEARAVLHANASKAVQMAGILTAREISRTLNRSGSNRGATPSAPGTPPHKDSGRLSQIHVDDSKLKDAQWPRVRVGTNIPYARILEFGGIILAKNGYLTIPLNQEARDMRKRAGASLRSVAGLVTRRSKKGNLLLGMANGKDFRPLFVLKKSVEIKKRPYMRPTFKRLKPRIFRLFSAKNLLAGFKGVRK